MSTPKNVAAAGQPGDSTLRAGDPRSTTPAGSLLTAAERDALTLLRAQNAQPVTPKHSAGARRAGERHTAAARVDGARVAAPGGRA